MVYAIMMSLLYSIMMFVMYWNGVCHHDVIVMHHVVIMCHVVST